MKYHIEENLLTEEMKKRIFQGFARQATNAISIDGPSEDLISFEIYDGSDFVGTVVVQLFWEQLHIKFLFIEERYRGQGIGRYLMNHALEHGKKRGCHFAFVETMNFQAVEFYQRLGFVTESSRGGYAKDTILHYLKKSLAGASVIRKITRTGVYGLAIAEDKVFLIEQKHGPFAGRLDFPGGRIEFGESVEQALRREFAEEVAMSFMSCILFDNLTTTTDVPKTSAHESYCFYQIGMIYRIEGLLPLNNLEQELQHIWIDPKMLSKEKCSSLLWQFLQSHTWHIYIK
ncbi:bifunctional GNAT family N-acetyltransferase/NUDIX hydrolase [Parachlamydia acanthamoebae]|uniref:bifunctional GNAT family N-acetyltransferase/NUDIX hydrolase n=1 Tax=Parachlamydia acanthamoebae TaxID=83552 RepID=UPI000750F480|nr:bifunctional GNAT family N-acetyltransferase/NUDIX hydrolase [Parachlamydia acanthamoebae]